MVWELIGALYIFDMSYCIIRWKLLFFVFEMRELFGLNEEK